MTVQEFLERLQGVRQAGSEWAGRCPAHDDRRASLSISEGQDGRVLLHCHAGCETAAILAALGLRERDLFADNGKAATQREIECAYDYTDELGRLLFQVVRFKPKGFAQRRPDGAGGWTWKLGDTRRVLFRLEQLIEAVALGQRVCVPEGERDVLALVGIGLCATTNAGGAGKWRPEYNESLRAAHVVLLPDNDEPGRQHAAAVAESLRDVAASVKVLELAGLPEKGDVSDWLGAGGTREELERLADAAPAADQPKPRFPGLTHADALARHVPPDRHLVADVIEAGTLGTIAGRPEAFKSWLAVEIAFKVAGGGGKVLGQADVLKTGPVSYWWQDDSERNELARLQAYSQRHGYLAELPLRWHLNERLKLPDDIPHLRAEIEREGQILAVLDSLYNFIPDLDPREPDVMNVYAQLKTEVCDATGCTIAIVDHAPWPTEGNRGQRRAYGSVLKHAATRWWIHAEPAE